MNERSRDPRVLLDEVTVHILEIDLSNIDFSSDEAIAANATKLDKYVRLLSIYKKMLLNNPGYPENAIDEEKSFLLRKQVEKLSDALDYYRVRRMVVSNSYYQTHYNEELSLNALPSDPIEKQQLARLLRAAYYLGKNLSIIERGSLSTQPMSLSATGELAEKDELRIHRVSKDPRDYENDSWWNSMMEGKNDLQKEGVRRKAQEELVESLWEENA